MGLSFSELTSFALMATMDIRNGKRIAYRNQSPRPGANG